MSKPVRLGIVGCAHACKDLHRPWLLERPDHWEVRGLFDLNSELATSEAEAFGGEARAEASLEALLARPDIDVVCVFTKPPTTHHLVAKQILAAGKHCWIEKPFAQTTEECDQLLALADANGVDLFVYQNRRWDANYQAARQIVDSGQVGEPVMVTLTFGSQGGRCSNLDWGVHIMDQALRFGRGKLEQVHGWCSHPDGTLDETGWASADLHFEHGPLVRIQFMPLDKEPDAQQKLGRFFILGDSESAVVPQGEDWPDQRTMYTHLYAWMREGGPRPLDPIGARNAIYTFELMLQSARQGRSITPDNWRTEDDAPKVV